MECKPGVNYRDDWYWKYCATIIAHDYCKYHNIIVSVTKVFLKIRVENVTGLTSNWLNS